MSTTLHHTAPHCTTLHHSQRRLSYTAYEESDWAPPPGPSPAMIIPEDLDMSDVRITAPHGSSEIRYARDADTDMWLAWQPGVDYSIPPHILGWIGRLPPDAVPLAEASAVSIYSARSQAVQAIGYQWGIRCPDGQWILILPYCRGTRNE